VGANAFTALEAILTGTLTRCLTEWQR